RPVLPAVGPAPDPELPESPPRGDDPALVEPIAQTILSDEPSRFDAPEARDVGALLLVMAVVAGSLGVALTPARESRLVIMARIVLGGAGAGMLLGRANTIAREPGEPHPAPVLASAAGALATAVFAVLGKDRALAAEAATLSGIVVTAAAVATWLADS